MSRLSRTIIEKTKDTKKRFEYIIKNDPRQTEEEIFVNNDPEGFNHNSSEQQNYPGIQKHDPNARNKG